MTRSVAQLFLVIALFAIALAALLAGCASSNCEQRTVEVVQCTCSRMYETPYHEQQCMDAKPCHKETMQVCK